MTDDAAPRVGFLGFLSSLPGILAACAAVITALGVPGGLYVAHQQQEASSSPPEPAFRVDINAPAPTPAPEPVTGDEATLDAEDHPVLEGMATTAGDAWEELLDACFAGAEDACMQVYDTLARWCYQGSGRSCDVLYMVSPPGSDYQEYGATCGERIGWGEVESCEVL